MDLLSQDQIDDKALINLRGVVRTTHVTLNGRTFQNLEAFAPASEWEELSCRISEAQRRSSPMIYSYTQISQYLRCPRSYRYRYLDGWREKDTRAAMVFGRCFEKALGAYFEQQDCTAALFKEWDAFRDTPFEYRKGESWDRLLHQGIHLLEKFAGGAGSLSRILRRTCSSSSLEPSREAMSSFPISMRSVNSMASIA